MAATNVNSKIPVRRRFLSRLSTSSDDDDDDVVVVVTAADSADLMVDVQANLKCAGRLFRHDGTATFASFLTKAEQGCDESGGGGADANPQRQATSYRTYQLGCLRNGHVPYDPTKESAKHFVLCRQDAARRTAGF
jgi:hypothetical protein